MKRKRENWLWRAMALPCILRTSLALPGVFKMDVCESKKKQQAQSALGHAWELPPPPPPAAMPLRPCWGGGHIAHSHARLLTRSTIQLVDFEL